MAGHSASLGPNRPKLVRLFFAIQTKGTFMSVSRLPKRQPQPKVGFGCLQSGEKELEQCLYHLIVHHTTTKTAPSYEGLFKTTANTAMGHLGDDVNTGKVIFNLLQTHTLSVTCPFKHFEDPQLQFLYGNFTLM